MRTMHIPFLSEVDRTFGIKLEAPWSIILLASFFFFIFSLLNLEICCCVIKVSKNVSTCLSVILGFRESHVSHTGLNLHMAMITRLMTALTLKKATTLLISLGLVRNHCVRKTFSLLGASSPTSLSLRKWWSIWERFGVR